VNKNLKSVISKMNQLAESNREEIEKQVAFLKGYGCTEEIARALVIGTKLTPDIMLQLTRVAGPELPLETNSFMTGLQTMGVA